VKKKELDKKLENDNLVEKESKYFNESRNARSSSVEKQWMINMAYYKGWQNLKYDIKNGSLTWNEQDPLKFYVNLIYMTVRAVRNAVLKAQPVWDVDARPYVEDQEESLKTLGQFLGNQYDVLGMPYKVKEALTYGLIYGLGVFQYGYDKDIGMWVETLDPFDTYFDPVATSIEDSRFVIKVIRKSVEEIKANPVYKNTEELKGDKRVSESPYKEQLYTKAQDSSGSDTCLLHEMWVKTDKGIEVLAVVGKEVIRNEVTDLDKLPFILYQPDVNPHEIYSEGWVKNLVPLNKAINQLERNVLEFNNIFSKGKYLMDKGAKVKAITNENGQIIKVTRGYRFEQMDIKPMSSTPFNQIANLQRYMQDIGAAQEALLGRAPTGVSAAKAFEELVANAYVNFADLADNLVITLEKLGTAALEMGSKYLNLVYDFKTTNLKGEKEIKMVTGMEGPDDMEGVVKIPSKATVKVVINSGVAYTKAGKQDIVFRLRSTMDIDRRTMLDTIGFDSDTVEERLQQEKMAEMQMQAEAQIAMQPPMPPQGAPEGATQGQGATNELSDQAIQFVQELEAQGLKLGEEFMQDPALIEQLASGQLEYHVMEDGTVMSGPEM